MFSRLIQEEDRLAVSDYSDAAHKALHIATARAMELKHNYVGTEHMLLGILEVRRPRASRVLRSQGLNADAVKDEIVDIIGMGTSDVTSPPPLTPRLKHVLDRAQTMALQAGELEVTIERVLFSLILEHDSVAYQVLDRRVDINEVARRLYPGEADELDREANENDSEEGDRTCCSLNR